MPRVICELPNASAEISGVKFHLLDDGRRLSDEIGDEAAKRFCSIPGYLIDEEEREEEPQKEPEAPKLTKAQQKALAKKQAEEAAAAQAAAQAAEQGDSTEENDAGDTAGDQVF